MGGLFIYKIYKKEIKQLAESKIPGAPIKGLLLGKLTPKVPDNFLSVEQKVPASSTEN